MKPAPFEYDAPTELEEALALLARHGEDAKVLAGGQSLVPLLNFRLARPARLIDVNRVAELGYLRRRDGVLRIGALTRAAALERSRVVGLHWPLLREAVRLSGHPQIRSRGTVGGSVAHADPASELPAVLTALDARFHIRSARGARTLRAEELFLGFLSTALEPDELLVEIEVPPLPPRTGTAIVEHARTHGDFAVGGAAAVLTLGQRGRCERVAIVLLAAGPAPRRAAAAEDVSRGSAGECQEPSRGSWPGGRGGRGALRPRVPARARRRARRAGIDEGGRPRQGSRVTRPIALEINGRRYEAVVEPRTLLSDFIRHEVGLTGTNVGCEHGVCGACTIQLDEEPVRSCLMLAVQADGRSIRTVEALAGPGGRLHPLQEAFRETHALQCGFCTPGFLMSLESYLREHQDPDEHRDQRGARRQHLPLHRLRRHRRGRQPRRPAPAELTGCESELFWARCLGNRCSRRSPVFRDPG